MSKAPEFRAPILPCVTQAVGGWMWSGEEVDTIMSSTSIGSTSADSRHCFPARAARSEVVSLGAMMRRSAMPVFSRIHSSLVSIIRSKSLFDMTCSGA